MKSYITSVPPLSWASANQEAFIQGYYNQYVQCQAKKDYSGFWAPFYEEWFVRYPERMIVFPDIPVNSELSDDQKKMVVQAVKAQQEQLRNKLRNMWGTSKKTRQAKFTENKVSTALIADLLEAKEHRTRKPQLVEAYVNLFYDEKIKPTIKGAEDVPKSDAMAAVAGDIPKPGKCSSTITDIMNASRVMFEGETKEVKAMVEARRQEMVNEKQQNKGGAKNGATKGKKYYVDKLASTLGQFFGGLQDLTGWSFSVLMGGPVQGGHGEIETCSFHVGKTELGYTFDQACAEYGSSIMGPYTNFLERVYASHTPMSGEDSEVAEGSTSGLELAAADASALAANPGYPSANVGSSSQQMTNTDLAPQLTVGEKTENAIANNFQYDFGHQAAIDPLDSFLARYGDLDLMPLPPESPPSNTILYRDQVLPLLPPANPPLDLLIPIQSTHHVSSTEINSPPNASSVVQTAHSQLVTNVTCTVPPSHPSLASQTSPQPGQLTRANAAQLPQPLPPVPLAEVIGTSSLVPSGTTPPLLPVPLVEATVTSPLPSGTTLQSPALHLLPPAALPEATATMALSFAPVTQPQHQSSEPPPLPVAEATVPSGTTPPVPAISPLLSPPLAPDPMLPPLPLAKPTAKRVRMPSKRNEAANSIGNENGGPKKRPGVSNTKDAASKKKKTG